MEEVVIIMVHVIVLQDILERTVKRLCVRRSVETEENVCHLVSASVHPATMDNTVKMQFVIRHV